MLPNQRFDIAFQLGNAHGVRPFVTKPVRQMLGNQQRGMAVRAFFRHLHVGHQFIRVDHRHALAPGLLNQSGCAFNFSYDRGALRHKIRAFLLAEARIVSHRVVQQSAKQSRAQPAIPALFGVRKRLVHDSVDALFGRSYGHR